LNIETGKMINPRELNSEKVFVKQVKNFLKVKITKLLIFEHY